MALCSYLIIKNGLRLGRFGRNLDPIFDQIRYIEKDPPGSKAPAKTEKVDKMTMPGFVNPERTNEEGYFTQHAKQQIEELRKKLEKPPADDTDKKE